MKKMAAVVGLSVFCATAFAAAQPKNVRESCEQDVKAVAPTSVGSCYAIVTVK